MMIKLLNVNHPSVLDTSKVIKWTGSTFKISMVLLQSPIFRVNTVYVCSHTPKISWFYYITEEIYLVVTHSS